MKTRIQIQGEKYTFVKKREYTPIYVYKGHDKFLKIGSKKHIEQSIAAHSALLHSEFPVSGILKIGTKGKLHYFIESSLGDKHFGNIFANEFRQFSEIKSATFNSYLKVTKRFAEAQSKIIENTVTFTEFSHLIHFHILLKELPHLSNLIHKAFSLVQEKLKYIPIVLSHGDLNPHNIYKLGLNDTEEIYFVPYGYDLISNIAHIYFFPIDTSNEFFREYEFTPRQHQKYFKIIEDVAQKYKLPNPLHYIDEFIVCRAIWSVSRQYHTPKFQEWSYKLFANLLHEYINGQDLWKWFTHYESLFSYKSISKHASVLHHQK